MKPSRYAYLPVDLNGPREIWTLAWRDDNNHYRWKYKGKSFKCHANSIRSYGIEQVDLLDIGVPASYLFEVPRNRRRQRLSPKQYRQGLQLYRQRTNTRYQYKKYFRHDLWNFQNSQ